MKSSGGFTLVEMAIVLIIVGLLVAGVFSAQTLVRASKLQAVLSEYDTYLKAVGEFQDKYFGLPGDLAGNSGFTPVDKWGTDPCGCPCTTASTKTAATCNGDGNGSIGTSDMNASLSNSYEWFRAWQQLSDAGFIQGAVTGSPGVGGIAEAVIGTNVPASTLSGAGWTLHYFLFPANGSADNGVLWRDQYGHLLTFGAYKAGSYTYNPIIKPEEAFGIDSKIDDGKPGRGKVRAWRTARQANCTTGDTTQDLQTYSTNNSGAPSCSLTFVVGF